MKVLNLDDLHSLERELSVYHIKSIAFAKQAHLELMHDVSISIFPNMSKIERDEVYE